MFKTTTLAVIAAVFSAPAFAATISAYDTVNAASVSAGITGAGVTAAPLVRGSGVAQNGNGNHFRARNWIVNGGTEAAALAANDYFEWGFTSTSTYALDTLSIRYDRNNNGPLAMSILASMDGGAFTQIYTDTSVSSAQTTVDIDLSAFTVDGATFRLVAWNATTNGGSFLIRNNGVGPGNDYGIELTGTQIAVVPLPATLPFLAGALGLFGLACRKA